MLDNIADLSHHNHKPDFKRAAAAGIYGVLHKATQGSQFIDPTFSKRRNFIEDSGLKLGAYHFLTSSQPVQQAEHFLDVASQVPLLVVDWESSNGKLPSVSVLSEFIRFVHSQGRELGLYLGQADLIEHFEDFDDAIGQCWLFIARYGKMPDVPLGRWKTWTLHQYTDGLHNHPVPVSGLGYCDRSKFNGSMESLERLWSIPLK